MSTYEHDEVHPSHEHSEMLHCMVAALPAFTQAHDLDEAKIVLEEQVIPMAEDAARIVRAGYLPSKLSVEEVERFKPSEEFKAFWKQIHERGVSTYEIREFADWCRRIHGPAFWMCGDRATCDGCTAYLSVEGTLLTSVTVCDLCADGDDWRRHYEGEEE